MEASASGKRSEAPTAAVEPIHLDPTTERAERKAIDS